MEYNNDSITIFKEEIPDYLSKYGCDTVEELEDMLYYEYGVDLLIQD